jgi:hypothetical protein
MPQNTSPSSAGDGVSDCRPSGRGGVQEGDRRPIDPACVSGPLGENCLAWSNLPLWTPR